MLGTTFKMNSKNFSQYANKMGLTTTYSPVQGLSSKYTMDGTEHDDVIANKATHTIRLNPVPPAIAAEILTEYRAPHIFLTIFDVATGADVTILCKSASASGVIKMVKHGSITYWQLGDLVFKEL